MKFQNRTEMNKWQRSFVLLTGAICMALLSVAPAQAAPDAAFVVDAIAKAKEAPTDEGTWQVTAKVVFTSDTAETMVASGSVDLVMTPDAAFKGIIPMQIGDNAETSKTNALGLLFKPNGTVGIQRLIAGKPFLGRPTLVFEASPFPDHLSKLINWGNAVRRMNLTLTTVRVKPPRIRVPKGDPPQIRVPKAKEPIGKRYKLTGYLVVTNSDDGVGDNTVELNGSLSWAQFGEDGNQELTRKIFTLIPQPVSKGARFTFAPSYADYIFDKPNSRFFTIYGLFWDTDDASGNDFLFDRVSPKKGSLKLITTTTNERRIAGDEDSESLDVYYTITFVKDLYEGDVK